MVPLSFASLVLEASSSGAPTYATAPGVGIAVGLAFARLGYNRAVNHDRNGWFWALVCFLTSFVGFGVLWFMTPRAPFDDGLAVSSDEQLAAAERLKRGYAAHENQP